MQWYKVELMKIFEGSPAKTLGEMSIKIKNENWSRRRKIFFDGFGIGGSFTKEDMTKILKITNEKSSRRKASSFSWNR